MIHGLNLAILVDVVLLTPLAKFDILNPGDLLTQIVGGYKLQNAASRHWKLDPINGGPVV